MVSGQPGGAGDQAVAWSGGSEPGNTVNPAAIDAMDSPTTRLNDDVVRVRRSTQTMQVVASLAVRQFSALRWLTWLGAGANLAHAVGLEWIPTLDWFWIALGWVLFVAPPGRMILAALAAVGAAVERAVALARAAGWDAARLRRAVDDAQRVRSDR